MRCKASPSDSENRVNRFLAAHPAPAEALAEVLEGRTPPFPQEAAARLSLWRLYSNGKTAWVVGEFPPQGDPEGRGFAAARSAWSDFTDRGSGSCLAGPGAWQQAERETPVLVPELAALRAQRDALADALEEIKRGLAGTSYSHLYHLALQALRKAGR